MSIESGVLYVVATPIGNLEDISRRALQTLATVDQVIAEDTRHTRRLLQHFGITARLSALHEHNERTRVPQILADLRAGQSIALVSDAGTPLISDPGFHLLRSVHQQRLRAIPIPGPSSVIAALSVGGLPTNRFVFEGFLPAKAVARRSCLETLRQEERTLVFFEASHRIRASLSDMADVFGGDRHAVLGRELTKLYEEIRGDSLQGLCDWIATEENRGKGEFVVLVHGAPKQLQIEPRVLDARRLLTVLLDELPVKRAVAAAMKVTGLRKNILYDLALAIKSDEGACN